MRINDNVTEPWIHRPQCNLKFLHSWRPLWGNILERRRVVNTMLIELPHTDFTLFVPCIVIQLLQLKRTKCSVDII